MNAIALALVVLSFILLLYLLLRQSRRGVDAAELQQEIRQRTDEPALQPPDEITSLMPQPKPDGNPNEMVTTSLPSAGDQTRCPACGETITAQDELCPSCGIAFVSDGSPKWTLGAAGPSDVIYRRPTEISE